ncbi:urea ABC transporter permease subunit UrtB [Thalassolituus sp. ST750PaO-4]|uniref:urea ABC transporter permease subunit UrtB n=1 Tax=Thalassolituus sp. ST750PaO-4 TaxID=2742965 RepID=UPI001CE32022|nr:urea ABC transporter permease subunit UrtB [Thalassolituus sp. ST750PaO-4]MCA6059169.1 urea ABC transporter permease subunit UrtB [Thalassolituus sp. ST750PaO-4]
MFTLFRRVFFAVLLLSASHNLLANNADTQPSLAELSQQLISANYKEKAALAEQIALAEDDQAIVILQALLDSRLYYVKSNGQLLLVDSSGEPDSAQDAFTLQAVTGLGKRDIKKIGVNNSLRVALRSLISRAQISSKHKSQRMAAAQNLLKSSDDIDRAFIDQALQRETDNSVAEVLHQVRALMQLKADQTEERIEGLTALDGALYPEVRAGLSEFIRSFSDEEKLSRKNEYQLAQTTLTDIEKLVSINGYIENLYFGLALGAVLLLAAIGLAITFGVMGVINMAHGEMIMLGAYTTYVVQLLMPEHIGLSLVVAVPAAFLVSGLVGVLIERSVIRHLYGRPLETLLATFGISLILQQAVRSIFSPLNREVATPDWMAGTFMINPALELTWNRLYIIIFSLMVLAVLALVLKRTLFGLQMRAVTMNRPMASSMGIKTGWVDALTFGLGSGIAGIAGVALSQLTNVGPNLGQAYIIDSFMVVVFGGVGNLWGTLVGAMTLGVANKIFEPLAGAVLAKIMVLVFIILFIQKRPRGLFALKGRAVDNG